ncbi:polyprenyl synthetase family protein [Natronobacterium gregoryi]|nr:hypothetical protein [Natronobacterium gregoryi]AFZ73105.1 hypothetical protein Natgr_1921 [Natronobacterium gregoryi SP2]SFI61078.1 hypothetical protein SAMN05443661_102160 [Natronobacterium gregoryi]
MTEYTFVSDADCYDTALTGLEPPARRVASEALPPRSRSVPAALCTAAGAVAAEANRVTDESTDDIVASVVRVVVPLEGYVDIRRELVNTERYDATAEKRDAALLAGDYLHAAAYAAVDEAPIPDRRALELYRILTTGSTTLSHDFCEDAESDDRSADSAATLAGIAAKLGATALGATTDTRAAMETYGRSLGGALSARSPSSSRRPIDDACELTVQILSGDDQPSDRRGRTAYKLGDGTSASSSAAIVSESVEQHLERARNALERLEAVTNPELTPAGERSRPSLERLERATRVPFTER